ncbi:MAG: helix-turn-helix domain-containing protein [Omnitrophica bacterium]|nr:helix-turn-helix domain-containing protein [Candidatus Omnitrophota bacterium]
MEKVEQRYLNVKGVAAYLGTTPLTIYDWVRKRKVPVHKLNGSLKFDKLEIDRMMEENRVKEMD